jgi:hypothetical protein
MAKRKSSKSKSTGLGLGLDALIKAKTKSVTEREDYPFLESKKEEDEIFSENKDIKVEKTPKKRARKSRSSKTKTTKTKQKSDDSIKAEKLEYSNQYSSKESPASSIDSQRVEAVLIEVKKNPRISLWSARSAAVLRYLKKTQPEFSISKEASSLIEEAVKDRYPEIWDIFDDL